jgi:tRNA(adenine34) deaminase
MHEENFDVHVYNMGLALEQADLAYDKDEVPIGAVLMSKDGQILAQAHNLKESVFDPCGHAEIICIRKAAKEIESWRLLESTLYVTLEPCPMCLAAMWQARIGKVIFGAYDSKGGAISLNYNIYKDQRLNHQFSIMGGIRHYECSRLLSRYFREKRQQHKTRNS